MAEQITAKFNPRVEIAHIINWIRAKFNTICPNGNAVLGISGGKDSTITAALLARALGPYRVTGILMPNQTQADLQDAEIVVDMLGINAALIDISPIYTATCNACSNAYGNMQVIRGSIPERLSTNALINMPPRIRTKLLYSIAASLPDGGLVCNTCNASEDYIGYSTKNGDAAGDFAPLADYTVTEILQMGEQTDLLLPELGSHERNICVTDDRAEFLRLVHKTPADGLCGKSDEDNIGFSYAVLDQLIRFGPAGIPEDIVDAIMRRHKNNLHKLLPMPKCPRLTSVWPGNMDVLS